MFNLKTVKRALFSHCEKKKFQAFPSHERGCYGSFKDSVFPFWFFHTFWRFGFDQSGLSCFEVAITAPSLCDIACPQNVTPCRGTTSLLQAKGWTYNHRQSSRTSQSNLGNWKRVEKESDLEIGWNWKVMSNHVPVRQFVDSTPCTAPNLELQWELFSDQHLPDLLDHLPAAGFFNKKAKQQSWKKPHNRWFHSLRCKSSCFKMCFTELRTSWNTPKSGGFPVSLLTRRVWKPKDHLMHGLTTWGSWWRCASSMFTDPKGKWRTKWKKQNSQLHSSYAFNSIYTNCPTKKTTTALKHTKTTKEFALLNHYITSKTTVRDYVANRHASLESENLEIKIEIWWK